ncbi:MAG: protein-methionine-sulfoxide reductase heme-binding subunit MsrQ [Pseudomonadota bacterium]
MAGAQQTLIKAVLWLLLAAPALWLAAEIWRLDPYRVGALGADPQLAVTRWLGEWGLRILLATLALSSVARLRRRPGWIRYRRLLGLFAFAYLSAHLIAYSALLAGFDLAQVGADLLDRPYITAGFVGWLLLLPLAVTSTRGWQRSLGPAWRTLHRLSYPALVLGLLHLVWLTKDGYFEVVLYTLAAFALFWERWRSRRR